MHITKTGGFRSRAATQSHTHTQTHTHKHTRANSHTFNSSPPQPAVTAPARRPQQAQAATAALQYGIKSFRITGFFCRRSTRGCCCCCCWFKGAGCCAPSPLSSYPSTIVPLFCIPLLLPLPAPPVGSGAAPSAMRSSWKRARYMSPWGGGCVYGVYVGGGGWGCGDMWGWGWSWGLGWRVALTVVGRCLMPQHPPP